MLRNHFVGSLLVFAGLNASAFATDVRYPFIMADGKAREVTIPLRFKGSSYLQVGGIADLTETKKILAPYGYYPVVVDTGTAKFASWSIIGAKHGRSELGQYNEIFVSILVTRKCDMVIAADKLAETLAQVFSTDPAKVPTDFGFYITKIWVTNEIAKLVGNEVWGFNKDMASIDVELKRNNDGNMIGFTMFGKEDNEVEMSFEVTPPKTVRPANTEFYLATRFKEAFAAWSTASNSTATFDAFDNKTDKFEANVGYGNYLKDVVHFVPLEKHLVKSVDLEVGMPLEGMLKK